MQNELKCLIKNFLFFRNIKWFPTLWLKILRIRVYNIVSKINSNFRNSTIFHIENVFLIKSNQQRIWTMNMIPNNITLLCKCLTQLRESIVDIDFQLFFQIVQWVNLPIMMTQNEIRICKKKQCFWLEIFSVQIIRQEKWDFLTNSKK